MNDREFGEVSDRKISREAADSADGLGIEAAVDKASEMLSGLDACSSPRDIAGSLFEHLAGGPGAERAALYLLGPGGFPHSAFCSKGLDVAPSLSGGTRFVSWAMKQEKTAMTDEFLRSAGALSDEEMRVQERLVESGLCMACAAVSQQLSTLLIYGSCGGRAASPPERRVAELLTRIARRESARMLLQETAVHGPGPRSMTEERRNLIDRESGELCTLLGIIRSSLSSIDGDDPSAPLLIDMARDAAMRMGSSVERLAVLCDTGGSERSVMSRIDVASLFEECCRPMIPEFERSEVAIEIDDRTGRREYSLDGSVLRTVISGLLGETLACTGRGGRISVEISSRPDPPERMEDPPDASEEWIRIVIGAAASGGERPPDGSRASSICGIRNIAAYRDITERVGGSLIAADSEGRLDAVEVWIPIDY